MNIITLTNLSFIIIVDGQWLPMSNWTECDVSCGGGTQMRERACVQPMYGGADCNGSASEAHVCNNFDCPGQLDGVTRYMAIMRILKYTIALTTILSVLYCTFAL